MHVLLSIKPRYVEAIVTGTKKFEFRKRIFRKKDVEKVYMYSVRPVGRIVGAFRVANILEDHPKNLWHMLSEYSGLDQNDFFTYFDGKEKGFAIEIEGIQEFRPPVDPKDLIPSFVPPQSFCYFDYELSIQPLVSLDPPFLPQVIGRTCRVDSL